MESRDVNVNGIERAVSAVVGGLLMRSGIRRSSALGMVIAAGGATLVYRGLSGRCPIYRKLGTGSTRELAERGASVRRAITIGRPPEEVYRRLRELGRTPEVLDHVESFESMGDGIYRCRLREAGFGLDCLVRLTEEESGRRLAWQAAEGSQLRCDGSIELRPAPGERGTELHVTLDIAPPGGRATSMLAPLIGRVGRFQLGGELHRLKQLIETGEIATSAMHPERRREQIERRPQQPQQIPPSREEVRP